MAARDEQLIDKQRVNTWLDLASDRLQQSLELDQILLFGSWARGTASRRSDLDLSIVWDTDCPPLERIGHILALLSDAPLPIEVIVYTPRELEQRHHTPFIRRVLQEGRVLYERRKTSA